MRRRFIFLLLALFSLVLVSCGDEIKIESVTISGEASGLVGSSINLTATILPTDAPKDNLKWSSSSETLATVDNNGKVSLLKAGEVTITADVKGIKGTFLIKINPLIEVESVSISGLKEGTIGSLITLVANVLPANATNKDISWTSSDEQLATVVNGNVTLLEVGTVTITAKAGDQEANHEITINPLNVAVESITISGETTGFVGEEIILIETVLPANATDKTVIWSSDNPVVATVVDGKVTLLSAGEVGITARIGIIAATHDITVTIKTESIEITGDSSGEVGDFIDLVAEVFPLNATNRNVNWSSSDQTVAKVIDGKVQLLKTGTVIITASQGNVSATFEIEVKEPVILVDDILIEAEEKDGIVGDELNILGRVQPSNATNTNIVWSSSDENIAIVANGKVVLTGVGEVLITATIDEISKDYGIKVYEDLDYLWTKLVNARANTVSLQTITHLGVNGQFDNKIYPSVFPYLINDPLDINMEHYPAAYHPNRPMESVEWVVIHDTAMDAHNAEQVAKTQLTSDRASWHFTVGDDGWFQGLADNYVAYHAAKSGTVGFIDTGILAVSSKERAPLGKNGGFWTVKGMKTNVPVASDPIADVGLWAVVMDGTYHIPKTSITGNAITLDGGNTHGIGIETSILRDSDIWTTWHRTAKLVAHLLVKYDLSIDRVSWHNSFSNKACPNTAIRSGNIENWLDLIKFEYMVLTKFSDYDIDLITSGLNILFISKTGRVIGSQQVGNSFEYALKITAPGGKAKQLSFRTTIV